MLHFNRQEWKLPFSARRAYIYIGLHLIHGLVGKAFMWMLWTRGRFRWVLLAILVVLWVPQLLEIRVLLVGPREARFYQGQKSMAVSQEKYIHKNCTRMFIATLFMIVKNWEKTMAQNLWDAAKAVLRGKFIAIQSYLKKQEKSQINNLNSHWKQLEKEEQKKSQS